jgi:type IV pilus assembly protein PilC
MLFIERMICLILGPQMGKKTLARLLRRLGQGARAGVGPLESWELEVKSTKSASHKLHLAQIRQDLSHGEPLHQAMARCDGLFPPLCLQMVEIGDLVGRMDDVLTDLADYYDRIVTLRRAFLLGIMWPCIQLIMAIMVVGLMILILGMIGDGNIDILGFGLTGTRGVLLYFGGVFTIGALGTVAILGMFRGWYGTVPLQVAMRIPAMGTYLRDSSLARMSWTLAMALEAGVDAIRSMQMALDSTQNIVFQHAAPDAVLAIRSGREFHESLRGTGVFPTEFVDSLQAAELAGSESTSLLHLSEMYSQKAQAASKTVTVVSGFLIWGMIAMIIIALIFRIAMFYLGAINEALDMVNGGI